jgi:hypothetical protein
MLLGRGNERGAGCAWPAVLVHSPSSDSMGLAPSCGVAFLVGAALWSRVGMRRSCVSCAFGRPVHMPRQSEEQGRHSCLVAVPNDIMVVEAGWEHAVMEEDRKVHSVARNRHISWHKEEAER